MGLTEEIKQSTEQYIIDTLRRKFKNYEVGDEVMPFHFRLLGKDRMALYSFIQSINTMFGSSIFEQTAIRIAKNRFKEAKTQVRAFNKISHEAQSTIQSIIDKLSFSQTNPDKQKETELILIASRNTKLHPISTPRVDVWLEAFDGELFLIDIKTVKPNKSDFIDFKRTLLEWVAVGLAESEDRTIHSLIAMPYNPYEPEPYRSWQMRGMLDLDRELLVGKAFWDFVGGEGAYEDLLDCFETAGIILRPEIDAFFTKFSIK